MDQNNWHCLTWSLTSVRADAICLRRMVVEQWLDFDMKRDYKDFCVALSTKTSKINHRAKLLPIFFKEISVVTVELFEKNMWFHVGSRPWHDNNLVLYSAIYLYTDISTQNVHETDLDCFHLAGLTFAILILYIITLGIPVLLVFMFWKIMLWSAVIVYCTFSEIMKW